MDQDPRKDCPKSKPTLSDVASRAGVSLATASNALNQRRGVNRETKANVFAAAQKIGYLKHWRRQSSEQKKCHSVRLITYRKHGLIMQDTPFFACLIQGLEQSCSELGCDLLFSQITASSTSDLEKLQGLLHDSQIPVLLLATEMHAQDLAVLQNCQVPLVMLDSFFPQASYWTVCIANHEAGYLAGQYLIEQGHQKIGMVKSKMPFSNMQEREAGLRHRLQESGFDLDSRHVVSVEPTIEGSDRDFSFWLESNEARPTALFAGNDAMAVGAMRALIKHGIRIPQDISIMGMDNTSVCQAVHPELTSLHVHKKELARQALQLLLQLAENPVGPRRYLQLGVDLIERNSVAKRTL